MASTDMHTSAGSPACKPRACPVQRALVAICARVSCMALGVPVDPEVCMVNVSWPDSQACACRKTRCSYGVAAVRGAWCRSADRGYVLPFRSRLSIAQAILLTVARPHLKKCQT